MRALILTALLLLPLSAAEIPLLAPGAEAPPFVLPSQQGTREYLRTWCGEKLAKPFVNSVPRRVVLSFWSTTCLPCMREIPELHKYAQSHAADSVKIFLVNLDNMPADEVDRFVKSKGWTLPVLYDPYQSVAKRYSVTALPTIYVISPKGLVEKAVVGVPAGISADAYLDSVLGDKKVPASPAKDSSSKKQ